MTIKARKMWKKTENYHLYGWKKSQNGKVPLLTKWLELKRFHFAKVHIDCPEEKCCGLIKERLLFLGLGATESLSELRPRYTVKHGGASIMLRGCVSYCAAFGILWYLSHPRDHESV